MPKIKLDKPTFDNICRLSAKLGYSSADEFISHVLQKEIKRLQQAEDDPLVLERLKGLGYI